MALLNPAIRTTAFALYKLCKLQFVIASLMFCLATPQVFAKLVSLTVLHPARVANFEVGTKVSIAPLRETWQGDWGSLSEDIAHDLVTTTLSNLQIDEQNYFEVLDLSQVLSIIQSEQDLRKGGAGNINTLPDLSDVPVAEYIVSGSVIYYLDLEREPRTYRRNVCVLREDAGGLAGEASGEGSVGEEEEAKCIEWSRQETRLLCEIQTVGLTFSPKISVALASREHNKYEEKFEEIVSSSSCSSIDPWRYSAGTRIRNTSDPLAVVNRSFAAFLKDFALDIAPYYKRITIYIRNGGKFKEVADKKLRKRAKKKFKYARNLMDQDLDSACAEFDQLKEEVGYADINLAFNLGVCGEIKEDFSSAIAYYEHVNEDYKNRHKNPPGWYYDAVERLEKSMERAEKLGAQL